MKVIIIGGVAGGASTAARLRRNSEDVEIVLFEKGEYISFANCGLPYYIGEVINDKEKLLVQTPEKMKSRFNIDVRINSEVKNIDIKNKSVEVLDLNNNKTYIEFYDKLVLSPGAEPIKPNIEGINSTKIYTLRNMVDTFKIKEYVDAKKPKRAVVVGAGFIGLEMAENLNKRGIKVTVVEMAEHVIGPLDFEMAALVHQHMKTKNIEFYLGDGVTKFKDCGNWVDIHLSSNRVLKSDLVIMSIGVRPESKLAIDAGLEVGVAKSIVVDEYLRTSNKDIYAVGDAIQVNDFINNVPVVIPLAGPANKQGRIVANNILGKKEKYKGTQGTSIVKVFDITVATTGTNEKTLKRLGIEYEKSFTHSPSHAGYYPGAIPMSIKLIFNKQGKILGAQIIGYEGVDKRIDVIATAIRANMTVFDLEELELAYAPPYSSAKDPVNIAGFVASNIINEEVKIFHWDNVSKIEDGIIVDVRDKFETNLGMINGAINIPLDNIRANLNKLPKDKNIYLYCQVGLRGYVAYRILKNLGYNNIWNLSGGLKTYNLALEKQSNEDIYENDKIMKDDEIKTIGDYSNFDDSNGILELDACGLQCPGPIMKVFEKIESMNYGEIVKVSATDPAFKEDIKAWCNKTGNELLDCKFDKNTFVCHIKKNLNKNEISIKKNDKTLVVFSNDLDRAIAAFIIANGAAAMGRKVTMFFTFWGLNILRRNDNVKTSKDFISIMFSKMMPKGSKKLSLSKMNMGGIGSWLIRSIMKKKNVTSLEELIQSAVKNNISLIACNMSMDIMGIKKEELIDGVTIGGVAAFLGSVEDSDMGLFI